MWTFAREYLRLTTEEFWSLTPREYTALCRRHDERVLRDAWMMYRAFNDPESLITPEEQERRYYAKLLNAMDKSIAML